MKELLKLMEKKKMGEGDMSEKDIMAKMDVLKELLDMANSSEGKGIASGLQKLTIAAPDKEGLMEGMEKAEDVLEEMPEGEEDPKAMMLKDMMDKKDEEEDEDEDM